MNPKIEKFLLIIWSTALFTLCGGIFNTGVAFASLWFDGIQVVVAALTGYGLYHLVKGSKL
jgi:hypothetical protein